MSANKPAPFQSQKGTISGKIRLAVKAIQIGLSHT